MKDNRKFNWFTVENSLIDREDITPMEMLMYVVLARYANNNEKCFPGLDLISKKTGIKDKRTITKHLKSLSEKGFITIQKRPGKSNLYYLNNVEEVVTKNVPTTKIVPPTKIVPQPPTKNVPTSSDKKCTPKKNYLKRTNKKNYSREREPAARKEDFDFIYKSNLNTNTQHNLKKIWKTNPEVAPTEIQFEVLMSMCKAENKGDGWVVNYYKAKIGASEAEKQGTKATNKSDKVRYMLRVTPQEEVDDLLYKIALDLGYDDYNSLDKTDGSIVNIELERILCDRYNKLKK